MDRYGTRLHHAWLPWEGEAPGVPDEVGALLLALLPVSQLLRAKPVFMDVGAGIGLHTLLLRERCPTLEVVAFEPAPVAWGLLQRTVRDAGMSSIRIEKVALGEHRGSVEAPAPSRYGVPPESAQIPPLDRVPCSPLDELNDLPPPSILRISRGAEPHRVLAGASKTIASALPLILLEWPDTTPASVLFSIAAQLGCAPVTPSFTLMQRGTIPRTRAGTALALLVPLELVPRLEVAQRMRAERAEVLS